MSISFVIERNRGDLTALKSLGESNHYLIYDSGVLDPHLPKSHNATRVKSHAVTRGLSILDFLLHDYRPGLHSHTVFASCDALGSAPNLGNLVELANYWDSVQCLSVYDCHQGNIPPDLLLEHQRTEWLNDIIPIRTQLFSLFDLTSIDHLDARYINLGMDYCNKHRLPYGTALISHFLSTCGFYDLAELSRSYTLGRRSPGFVVGVRDNVLAETVSRNRDSFSKMQYLLLEKPDTSSFLLQSVFMHLFGMDFVKLTA